MEPRRTKGESLVRGLNIFLTVVTVLLCLSFAIGSLIIFQLTQQRITCDGADFTPLILMFAIPGLIMQLFWGYIVLLLVTLLFAHFYFRSIVYDVQCQLCALAEKRYTYQIYGCIATGVLCLTVGFFTLAAIGTFSLMIHSIIKTIENRMLKMAPKGYYECYTARGYPAAATEEGAADMGDRYFLNLCTPYSLIEINRVAAQFCLVERFSPAIYKGERVLKKGNMFRAQFVKLQTAGERVHIEAWKGRAFLPEVYTEPSLGERDLYLKAKLERLAQALSLEEDIA